MREEEFSLDARVYKKGQDFSITYRELLNLIKRFNDNGTLPTKSDIIIKKFGSKCNDRKFIRRKITDMLNILKRKKYIRVSPIFDDEGKYVKNIYEVIEKE